MTKPTKPKTDNRLRVFRGGGWYSTDPSMFRSEDRSRITPALRSGGLGFRCAQRGSRQPLKVQP